MTSYQLVDEGLHAWIQSFRSHVSDLETTLSGGVSHLVASNRLRQLVKSGILSLTSVRDSPERFFAAHRILSEKATILGPGFGIRFTVQFNLFAGTVTAIGSEPHLAQLAEIQGRGQLGCFALTERLAGVNSGLVVETVCTWDPSSETYELHTPYPGATKNWISQGCTADYAVVMANLLLPTSSPSPPSGSSSSSSLSSLGPGGSSGGGKETAVNKMKNMGPHAFLMRMRDERGTLVSGVQAGDMGTKTIGNDLDNAWITFDRVRLPKSALLNRFVDVGPEGTYVQKVKGVANIDMIGQRLYTGRIVIAESAIIFAKTLFASTKAYSDEKKCWAPGNSRPTLSQIPQLRALYVEAEGRLGTLDAFLGLLQRRIAPLLRAGDLPPRAMVEAVAAAKVCCIETSIELCHRLKQEVGSFALMAGTGFEKSDYLQCCKFAEGDSRILMQKLARDKVGAELKRQQQSTSGGGVGGGGAGSGGGDGDEEGALCRSLATKLKAGGQQAWDDSWEDVYRLANLMIGRILREFESSSSSGPGPHQTISKM